MKMNKTHHQNNNFVMEDLVCGLVGMKDRRTKPLVENCINSPILHPYGRSFATTGAWDYKICHHLLRPLHMLPAIYLGRGCFHRNIIDMPGFFYRLIKQ